MAGLCLGGLGVRGARALRGSKGGGGGGTPAFSLATWSALSTKLPMVSKLRPCKPRAAALKSSTLRRISSGVPVLLDDEFVTGSAEAAPLDLS